MAKNLSDHNYNGIDATIIADSVNEHGNRLTTYILTFPRIILAELNTHRMFSRNSASSRAIPFKKMLQKVREHPFIPIAFQKDHKGMQGNEYLTEIDRSAAILEWLNARDLAVGASIGLHSENVTKQLCNRLLEPFMWHTAIVTASEFENFFALRCPQYEFRSIKKAELNSVSVVGDDNVSAEFISKEEEWKTFRSKKDAIEAMNITSEHDDIFWFKANNGQGEIHIMALAESMWDAMNESQPKQLKSGEWHIPFGDQFDDNRLYEAGKQFAPRLINPEDQDQLDEAIETAMIRIATARCARVSYLNFEGKDDYEADIKLHDRLCSMGHWSPFEHCAQSMSEEQTRLNVSGKIPVSIKKSVSIPEKSRGWSGNFKGFIQYRKMFENENVEQ